ncbi:MAG: class I SAM-dependent methyltransferase [Algoriphagus sp.]|uniref:class I SAM-dependent methyltransferase n=1 Tax=Algoriphagus sp. TaxID=1872435 RepID=UPI0017E8F3A8|nr:class I SAM-dependent methyltransferase [Algoriphagus sp.]NVJ87198.1 class I SAM-dependent methyltransferase [Algoriphagus sp.]
MTRFLPKILASSDDPDSLGAKFRKKRLAFFESLFFRNFDPAEPTRILDVGGTSYFWEASQLINYPNIQITLLNLHEEQSEIPTIHGKTGDATAMPEFGAKEFDLVFSNSVIEHLYTWENQQKMAEEIQRIGKRYYVQTPNRFFPIEAHYALPFAQYWPKGLLYQTLTKTPLSRFRKWEPQAAHQYLEEIRLLDESEMKRLFPEGKVYREKFLGMTKSITLHNLL